MKRRLLLIQLLFFVTYNSFSQRVGTGTTSPDATDALEITAPNKGLCH